MTDKISIDDIHPSIRKGFVPLPSDPKVPLTDAQLKALFPHPEVWREVIALTKRSLEAQAAQDKSA